MQVVEGCQQLDMFRQQHTVTKHISTHVTNTNNAKVLGLNIYAYLMKMSLHGNPSTTRGNTHAFMVVTITAT